MRYVVQGLWNGDSLVSGSERWFGSRAKAVAAAKAMLGSAYFEGRGVRVITEDSEMVWQRGDKREGIRSFGR